MKNKPNNTLHGRAENMLKNPKNTYDSLKKSELLTLIHEMEEKQLELEKLNGLLEQAQAEAEEAYRQYTDLYDFAPVGYFTLKQDGSILEVNLAGASLLGMERGKLIDSQLKSFVSAESQSEFNDFFEKLLSGTGKEACEILFEESKPDPLWVRIEATCFEGGQTCRAVMLSINERRHVESELRVSMTKYKTLFDTFPLGITVSDAEGNILETNPAAIKLLDVPQEEHTQRDIDDPQWHIVRPDESPMPTDEFASVRALKENIHIENMEMGIVKPDATTTWISVTAAPLPLEGYGVVVTYGDITERIKAERKLLDSEKKAQQNAALLRSVMESPQGIVIFALDTNFCYTAFTVTHKKIMKSLWNVEIETGMNILDAISGTDDREKARVNFERVLNGEQFILIEEYGDTLKHHTWYENRYNPILDENGVVSGIAVFVTDITERKKAEHILQTRLQLSQFADTHSLDELLQTALDEAETLTGSKIGFAHFIDEDQQTLHLQMWSTNTLANMCTAEGKGSHYPVDQAGVWAECVTTRVPVIHNDYPNLPTTRRKGLPEGHAPIHRELVIPVLRNDRVTMIMGVGNKSFEYDENDVEAVTQLAGLVWDIVQRKQAEEAVRETQELLTLFIKHSPIYTFIKEVTATESRVLQASNNFYKMIGIEGADMIGKTMQELFPPDLAAKFTIDDWDVVSKGQMLEVDEDLNGHHYNTLKFPLIVGNKTLLAGYTIDVTERKKAEQEIVAASAKLQTALIREQELARTDTLTGVNNRRHLYEQAGHEFQVAIRYQQTLSVIMFDIDHFKKVNDTFGHEAGDHILKLVADTATAELRSADVIGRYGGEEFIIILPMTNSHQAFQVAERIRMSVADLSISTQKGPAQVTLSIGIAELNGATSAETVEEIFRRADEAMYTAKQAGRNRTEIR